MCSFIYSLCLYKLIFRFKKLYSLITFFKDMFCSNLHFFRCYNIVRCRKNNRMCKLCQNITCERVYFKYLLHLISEKLKSECCGCGCRRENLQYISSHTKCTTVKVHIISVILHIYQLSYNIISVSFHTRSQRNHHLLIINGASQTVYTGH